MTFANPLPWWALVLVVAAAAAISWHAYRRSGLPPRRRLVLAALRFVTLLAIVVFLMRPVARSVDADALDAVVPILVDTSRSMGIEDASGADATSSSVSDAEGGSRVEPGAGSGIASERRIDRARALVRDRLLPALGPRFQVEVLGFGEALAPTSVDALAATGRRSDIQAALAALRARYRGRPLAGVVLISDGGDTGGGVDRTALAGLPVFPLGVGSPIVAGRDREVLSVTVAEAVLDDSRLDLAVSAVSHGTGRDPIELRLLENGRPLQVRRPVPAGDGSPVREVFQVSPDRGTATVYSIEVPVIPGELVPENNLRSVLVRPPARSRRVLLVEGAPGFEHSFLKRAWAADQGLEVDSVVRKGRNEQGHDTFYIQAARSRSAALKDGYPLKAEDLFQYDTLVLANVEARQLTDRQLESTRAFVGRRGGGLLVLGARSFLPQGLGNTPLEEVLPLDLNERSGGVLPASSSRGRYRVTLTGDGATHPVMQLAPATADSQQRWDEIPPLASIATLGGPRAGASVLAVTGGPGGALRALVAVQRYGEGRAMVFTGEASWRWRMMRPSNDRAYDTFWRQAVRWLALPAADPIAVDAPSTVVPGEQVPLRAIVRDASFEPVRDASVDFRVTMPDGRLETLHAAQAAREAESGWFVARFRAEDPGVYQVHAEAKRGPDTLGAATTSMLVGGADVEMADPRLNGPLLQRLARASGGRVLTEAEISSLAGDLATRVPAAALAVRRDLWHAGWSFALIVMLLASEWLLRRRWGLR